MRGCRETRHRQSVCLLSLLAGTSHHTQQRILPTLPLLALSPTLRSYSFSPGLTDPLQVVGARRPPLCHATGADIQLLARLVVMDPLSACVPSSQRLSLLRLRCFPFGTVIKSLAST